MPSSTPRSPETPTPSPQRREAQRPSGWDRYLSVLERHRVPASQRQWYVRRVEAFVEAVRPTRIGEVSAGQVTAFFTSVRARAAVDRVAVSPNGGRGATLVG